MARWAKLQAAEELTHFQQHIKFAKKKRLNVALPQINQTNILFSSPLEAFGQALTQEIKIGEYYHGLDMQASSTNQYALSNHLQKFVHEQEEEIDMLDKLVNRLTLAESDAALLILDQELAQR